ncbi:AsmA-like C-terminal domain-containing protein [uncultured Devosia sp.]|uniref:AsmA-like C-terminal domain-containing protein n=1 Tax=uncultured Devosia sp. TaxID=211434 RepID=UPI0035CA7F68
MSASITLPASQTPLPLQPRRPPGRHAAKLLVWLLGAPAGILILLYLVLLVTPIRLPFGSEAAQAMAQSALPPTSTLKLGQMSLALESGVWPVIHFSPVTLTDTKSGAKVDMQALEIGFSPVRALVGQPGATITIVKPHIQIVQDLFGPRVTSFQMVDDPAGGPPTVRVMEGDESFPSVGISSNGVDLRGPGGEAASMALRSDNDWLIYNLEASEQSLADIVKQTQQGRFSKLVIRDGTVDMNDAVYGLFRRFENINLEIGPAQDRRNVSGVFSATLGGKTMTGNVSRLIDDAGGSRLETDITNIDFASFLPFIDDAQSLAAIRGAGALSIDVTFAPQTGKLVGGAFKVDMTGLDLRLEDNYFPIVSSIMDITWSPAEGQFKLADAALQIGQSSAHVSGLFAMGLDPAFGPTIAISLNARDITIHPGDMDAPAEPFDTLDFSGWSAPLYGALGIDRLVATKGAARIETTGRLDMLQAGLGLDMTVAGENVGADDLKRLWPYMMGGDSRDWFVANVTGGTVSHATMRFKFPVGSMAVGDEIKPIPKDAMLIDMTGTGVLVKPTATMAPVTITGDTHLQVRDSDLTISAGGGAVDTENGVITVTNPALVMDNSDPAQSIAEMSGDISGSIGALVALARSQQPDAVASAKLPIDLDSLTGSVDLGLVATLKLPNQNTGKPLGIDYVLNGALKDFASDQPIQDRKIGNGQLSFSASQDGYQIAGTAEIDGMPADIEIAGTPTSDPSVRLGSTVGAKDLAAMGFDASEFLTGQVRFVAEPQADGSIRMAVDLKDAGLTIKDIGITKDAGVPGLLQATVNLQGKVTELSDIDLAFGSVHLAGALTFDADKGLQSAQFTQFALSEGDDAQLKLAPIDGGYAIDLSGAQLDLKPMLKRFFGLGEGAGGVQSTQFEQTLALNIRLDRALGYYATTAFNVVLDMTLHGTDLRRANMTAQFGDDNALSVTTNPAPDGRTMTVAFGDAGTILRLLGVYSQLAGGDGSLVLTTNNEQKAEVGQLALRNFSIVDEANVAQVLGNHADSRAVIAKQNRLDFNNGVVTFVRRSDRVEVTDAVLSGDTVGGTMRGFIYTDQRQYDLTGTYVPLFGLNSAFQKIPLLGPLLGGRDGEGLVGVTFAVKGALDNPEFKINPLSALVPGVLRELFEFRAKEQPRVE